MGDLTPEKSLLEIWSKALPQLPQNRFNFWISRSGLALGLLPFIFGRFPNFWGTVSPIIEIMVQVVAGLLGFIIAGYTIFASTSNPTFMIEMAKFVPAGSRLPLVKIHLLNFLRLFLYTFLALVILLGLTVLGRLWPVIANSVQLSERLILIGQGTVLAAAGLACTVVMTQIKSIIFNLYDLSLTQVRFLRAESEKKEKDRLSLVQSKDSTENHS